MAQARLLLAAALVATEGVEQGVETLAAIARGSLNDEDGSLMDAALAVAGQVRRPIESPTPAGVARAKKGKRQTDLQATRPPNFSLAPERRSPTWISC